MTARWIEPLAEAMLFPRFSLQLVLLANVALAVIFVVAKYALAGQPWAIGLILSLVFALILLGVFGLMFSAAYMFSFAHRFRRRPQTESPFATDKLPPQVVPPGDFDQ